MRGITLGITKLLSSLLRNPGMLLLGMGWWVYGFPIAEIRMDLPAGYIENSRSRTLAIIFVICSMILAILNRSALSWKGSSVIGKCWYLVGAYAAVIFSFVIICSRLPYKPVYGDMDPVSYIAMPSLLAYGLLALLVTGVCKLLALSRRRFSVGDMGRDDAEISRPWMVSIDRKRQLFLLGLCFTVCSVWSGYQSIAHPLRETSPWGLEWGLIGSILGFPAGVLFLWASFKSPRNRS